MNTTSRKNRTKKLHLIEPRSKQLATTVLTYGLTTSICIGGLVHNFSTTTTALRSDPFYSYFFYMLVGMLSVALVIPRVLRSNLSQLQRYYISAILGLGVWAASMVLNNATMTLLSQIQPIANTLFTYRLWDSLFGIGYVMLMLAVGFAYYRSGPLVSPLQYLPTQTMLVITLVLIFGVHLLQHVVSSSWTLWVLTPLIFLGMTAISYLVSPLRERRLPRIIDAALITISLVSLTSILVSAVTPLMGHVHQVGLNIFTLLIVWVLYLASSHIRTKA